MYFTFFLRKYFFPILFVFTFSAIPAHGQENSTDYTNSAYLPEIPKIPEFNPHILNCFKKDGYHVHTMKFSCPIGEKEVFLNPELTFPVTYGRNLDWEPASYIGFPPSMPVCPTNGAVITKPDYSDEELELLSMAVDTEEYKNLYAEKHASYFLYAELNRMLELDSQNRWWYLLHATWEASHCDAKDKYRFYALKTIDAAKKRLEELSANENEFWVLNIVIPNLYRRTADFKAAEKWLDRLQNDNSSKQERPESFGVAFQLLYKAIQEKNTGQVPLSSGNDGDNSKD